MMRAFEVHPEEERLVEGRVPFEEADRGIDIAARLRLFLRARVDPGDQEPPSRVTRVDRLEQVGLRFDNPALAD
jgi:hypothetical protein